MIFGPTSPLHPEALAVAGADCGRDLDLDLTELRLGRRLDLDAGGTPRRVLGADLGAELHCAGAALGAAKELGDADPVPRELPAWAEDELLSFLASQRETKYGPLWRVPAYTGMRRGEVLGLPRAQQAAVAYLAGMGVEHAR